MGTQQGAATRLKDTIFVVEDDDDVARTICHVLRKFEYKTEHFRRGHEVLRQIARKKPSLCVIDLGLPDLDGLEILRRLQDVDVATIVVTGRGDVMDRVLGLELGADDYLVKPFEPRELVARIASVLRRLQRSSSIGSRSMATFSGWTFDVDALSLQSPAGRTISLSRAEAQLLEVLARASNRVVSREFILDAIGAAPTFDRTIDVRVSRLRQKLEQDPQHPQLIRTVYGSGYLFASTVLWTRAR
jgi:DNA-binding response OmpR family regulator